MATYIQQLRTKHDKHKRRFAFGVSASITALIALFWVTSFSYFNNSNRTEQIAKTQTGSSPIQVLKRNVASAYQAVTGSKVENTNEEATSSTAELEYVPNPEE